MPRFDMFEMGVLRVDQQPRGNREGGALGLVGQAAKTERAADADRAVQDTGGEFDRAGELRGAAREDDPRLRLRCKGGIRQAVPHHLKNLLGAMPDDVCDRGAGHDLRGVNLVVARSRYGHQFSRVGPAGQHGAI